MIKKSNKYSKRTICIAQNVEPQTKKMQTIVKNVAPPSRYIHHTKNKTGKNTAKTNAPKEANQSPPSSGEYSSSS